MGQRFLPLLHPKADGPIAPFTVYSYFYFSSSSMEKSLLNIGTRYAPKLPDSGIEF